MLSMCAACTCTMRSHADENGVLHVTQCSHLEDEVDEDEDEDDEEEDGFVVVVVAEEEGDVVEEDSVGGDSSGAETQGWF